MIHSHSGDLEKEIRSHNLDVLRPTMFTIIKLYCWVLLCKCHWEVKLQRETNQGHRRHCKIRPAGSRFNLMQRRCQMGTNPPHLYLSFFKDHLKITFNLLSPDFSKKEVFFSFFKTPQDFICASLMSCIIIWLHCGYLFVNQPRIYLYINVDSIILTIGS